MLSTPKAKAELFLASSLYDGLEDNNIMQVTTLLLNKEADPNVLIPSQGITPFHLVIGNDSETFAEEVTKLFLRHGGNPNVKSVDGMTPVHVAAAWGRLGVLELLLSNGGDPLLVDDEGRSPFHYAFDEAHYDAVATLGKYCGESFEEDSNPKYNIALDKILVSNGGVVAEYAVSEESCQTIGATVPIIQTSNITNNNNDSLENLNNQSNQMRNNVSYAPRGQWARNYPGDIDVTITTTADESSTCSSKFITVKRHHRCLPRKKLKNVEHKLDNNQDKLERNRDHGEVKENLVDGNANNQFSVSHLNDPLIEASFVVKPQEVGENMPRISSPKADEKLVKSEYEIGGDLQDIESTKFGSRSSSKKTGKNKIVHKTPLRYDTRRNSLSDRKKTPLASAEKIYHLNAKTTPKNQEVSSNGKKAINFRTPNKYISKQSPYSPDCSIVSKSPNFIITPTTPTNIYYRRLEERKILSSKEGTPSSKELKKKLLSGTRKIPTPENICKNNNNGKSLTRFVKQSNLRYEGTRKTPASSPNRLHNLPTLSKKFTCTPNLTDSAKRSKFLAGRKKIVTTPSCSVASSPTTPLNKTYNKSKDLNTTEFSPDVEIVNRFIDRRSLSKNVAVRLEEAMYDDDCDKNVDFEKIPEIQRPVWVKDRAMTGSHLKDPVVEGYRRSTIDIGQLTSKECIPVPKVINKIADPIKTDSSESTGTRTSQSYEDAQVSHVLAGFFQPNYTKDSSAGLSNMGVIKSDAVSYRIPGLSVTDCSHMPNSKEIDDSLVSSEPSCYSSDNCTGNAEGLSNLENKNLKTNPEQSLKEEKFELYPSQYQSGLLGESCPRDNRKTCSVLPNVSSSVESSSYASFVSVEEEYKYEDAEEGVILLERRLLVTPVSIPMTKSETEVFSSSERISTCNDDESIESHASSLPHSLLFMDSETLRRELTKLQGRPPGPITTTTRHVYLKKLRKLQKRGPIPVSLTTTTPPKFSMEIERTLRSENWMNDLSSYEMLERQVFGEFSKPDPTRRWREGTIKSSFNYLLMDPRVTDNLPRRADVLSKIERWQTFLSSIFYVGKGKRSRPYAHLYEAYGEWKKGNRGTNDRKIDRILEIWKDNYGVVCLHVFQNTIPVEAYTREAAMIEALGLNRLKNSKSGDYYGVAATWSLHQKRTFGVYLLYKAMHILMNEGERQLCPDNIGR